MFKQVVPLDGSERAERAVRVAERIARTSGSRFAEVALAPARELARAFGSRILLVRAVSPHGLPSVLPARIPDIPGLTPEDGGGDGGGDGDDQSNSASIRISPGAPCAGTPRLALLEEQLVGGCGPRC